MYNASELFIIKDVLEIYAQQKQNNECMFITTCLESRAADDHKVKKFTEFLPCAFAMYDCRQLEDVSSVENAHMITDLLPQVFIRCYQLHLPSLSSVVPQAFGAQGTTLIVYDFILLCSHEEPSPSNTSLHPISLAIPPWTQP